MSDLEVKHMENSSFYLFLFLPKLYKVASAKILPPLVVGGMHPRCLSTRRDMWASARPELSAFLQLYNVGKACPIKH